MASLFKQFIHRMPFFTKSGMALSKIHFLKEESFLIQLGSFWNTFLTPYGCVVHCTSSTPNQIPSSKHHNPVYLLQSFNAHEKIYQYNTALSKIHSEVGGYQSKPPWVWLCIAHHQTQINFQVWNPTTLCTHYKASNLTRKIFNIKALLLKYIPRKEDFNLNCPGCNCALHIINPKSIPKLKTPQPCSLTVQLQLSWESFSI